MRGSKNQRCRVRGGVVWVCVWAAITAGAARAEPLGRTRVAPIGTVAAATRSATVSRDEGQRGSRLRAIGSSLLLPGLGQRATGHPGRARVFLAAEAAILIGYISGEAQGYVRKQSYVEYAEQFAGVRGAQDKPDWYYRNLGRFPSSDEYIDEIARTARAIYGDDLAQREAYVERNAPGPDELWAWRSEADRQEYRSRRQASRSALRRANLFLGAALLNRIVSAVDAARLAGRGGHHSTLFYQPTEDGTGYLCVQWNLD